MHISRAVNEAMRLIECNLIAMLVPDLSRPYRLILCNFIILFIILFFFNGIPLVLRSYIHSHICTLATKRRIKFYHLFATPKLHLHTALHSSCVKYRLHVTLHAS